MKLSPGSSRPIRVAIGLCAVLADKKNSQAGIIMPGTILLGARHYQEIAPNTLDRAEIVANNVTLKTPAGTFTNCLLVEEIHNRQHFDGEIANEGRGRQ